VAEQSTVSSGSGGGGNAQRGRGATLKSLTRALRLLRGLEGAGEGKSLTQLSREHGLHKTTALRLLRSLVAAGLVEVDANTGRYKESPAFWIRVAPFLGPAMALASEVRALLDRLARSQGGTALIVLPDATRQNTSAPVYALPPGPVRVDPFPSVVALTPLHATAGGKCYLAHVSEAELSEYVDRGLTQVTKRTISSGPALRRELAEVRRQGFAINRGEAMSGAPAVGVPLRHEDETVLGGLSLAFAGIGLEEANLEGRVPAVRETADAIEKLFSYDSFRRYMRGAAPSAPVPPPEPSAAADDVKGASPALVRSVGRALRVMAVVWEAPEGMSLTELARHRGLEPATAGRLIRTLAADGLARREPTTGRYHVDPVFWLRLSPILRGISSLESTLEFVLKRLAAHAGATAALICPDAARCHAVVCSHALPQAPAYFDPDRDRYPPLHATASGKCYLAFQPESAVDEYIAHGLSAETEHTITSAADLRRDLAGIRSQGYAVSKEESIPGAGELAVPVSSSRGEVSAALALVPLSADLTEANVSRWLPLLRVAGETLGRVLTADWFRRVTGRR
jgi:DNA-binding IclR family transcriptional regulator